jgi:hypothetical protein
MTLFFFCSFITLALGDDRSCDKESILNLCQGQMVQFRSNVTGTLNFHTESLRFSQVSDTASYLRRTQVSFPKSMWSSAVAICRFATTHQWDRNSHLPWSKAKKGFSEQESLLTGNTNTTVLARVVAIHHLNTKTGSPFYSTRNQIHPP